MADQVAKPANSLDTSTRLALERTAAAYDRTMMAWIRTATSLISFGFAIYKFFQIELQRGERASGAIGPREFALLMVSAGMLSLALGTYEHWQNMRQIRASYPQARRSGTSLVAGLILILGILALLGVTLRQ
jgi:putative membrane protein